MTVELVDGHAGTPHIDGDDLGDFKAGFIGSAGYVLDRDDCFKATLNNANSLSIGTGSAIMPNSGRHVRVTAPETLTITSGTAGSYRYDLVVLRATTSDGTTAESAELVVIQGTATSGTPTDPATSDGDLPLYRLSLDGITIAEPIALFDVLVPYAEFQDSISQDIDSVSQDIDSVSQDIDSVSQQIGVKLLWSHSSGYLMNASQTITLSESVSKQAHGIVLHWVARNEDSGAQNSSHQFFFFPKTVVDSSYFGSTGGGKSMWLTNSTGNVVGAKYVYITDTAITGLAENTSTTISNSTSGITTAPRMFTLVEVLGV